MALVRLSKWLILITMSFMGSDALYAQAYPSKQIRIVTGSTGGGLDFISRLLAQGLAGPLGQQIVVDNRGGGVIPGETVAKAAPDGYTLLLLGGTIWIGPLLEKTPYDPSSFAPITLAARAPNILTVNHALPVKSVKELIALAKARPGELNYAAQAVGTTSHLAVELFKSLAQVNLVPIFYKARGAEIVDLANGEVQLAFGTPSAVGPLIKTGKLRALAVTSAQPSLLYPNLPTVAAAGVPGYEATSKYGIWAPAKTPDAIITRLNQEIVRFLLAPETKERLLTAETEPVGTTPEAFAGAIKAEVASFSKVIKDTGLRVQ